MIKNVAVIVMENAKKLIKHKGNLNKLIPTDNEIKIPESTNRDLKTGSILFLVFVGITFLGSLLSMVMINNSLGYWNNYLGSTWRNDIIFSAVLLAVVSSSIPIIVMKVLTGEKRRKALPYFLLLILSFLGIFYLLFGLYSAFDLFRFNVILSIISLLSIVIEASAYICVMVGCMDFLVEANTKVVLETLQIKPESPMVEETKVTSDGHEILDTTSVGIPVPQEVQPVKIPEPIIVLEKNEASELLKLSESIGTKESNNDLSEDNNSNT